jgi:hypothetical protein
MGALQRVWTAGAGARCGSGTKESGAWIGYQQTQVSFLKTPTKAHGPRVEYYIQNLEAQVNTAEFEEKVAADSARLLRWQIPPTAWHTILKLPIAPDERCSSRSPGQTHIISAIDRISARSS